MPSVKNLETSLNSGLRVAVADYDAAASVPGVTQRGTERFAGPDGKVDEVFRVRKSAAALGRIFKEFWVVIRGRRSCRGVTCGRV